MSSISIFAVVIAPAVVAALGWGAVLLTEWHMKRLRRREIEGVEQQEGGRRLVGLRRFRGQLPLSFKFDRSEPNNGDVTLTEYSHGAAQ